MRPRKRAGIDAKDTAEGASFKQFLSEKDQSNPEHDRVWEPHHDGAVKANFHAERLTADQNRPVQDGNYQPEDKPNALAISL
jgi:hypothetical protein